MRCTLSIWIYLVKTEYFFFKVYIRWPSLHPKPKALLLFQLWCCKVWYLLPPGTFKIYNMTRLCTIPIYNSYLLEGCFICRFIGNLLFSQFLEMKYRIAYLFIKISFYSSYKNVDFFPINLLNRCFYEQEGSCIDVNCPT